MNPSRQYRLLKDLPDSIAGDVYIWNDSQKAYYKNGNVLDSYWKGDAIENNPTWFQLIEQREWEIVSFKVRNDLEGKFFTKSPNGLFSSDAKFFDWSEKQLLEKGYPIHSVKRLSDGEVFTVGDVICIQNNKTETRKIRGFKSESNRLLVRVTENRSPEHYYSLSNIQKLPPQKETQDSFVWTTKLVEEYFNWLPKPMLGERQTFNPDLLQAFIASKQQSPTPKEERKTVTPITPITAKEFEQGYLDEKKEERIEVAEDDYKDCCGVCGDGLVYIRGKYPDRDKRQVCATCNTERLEQINEISGNNYGKTCKA